MVNVDLPSTPFHAHGTNKTLEIISPSEEIKALRKKEKG